MDIDEALTKIRDAIASIRASWHHEEYDDVTSLADNAEKLDQWLSRGGYLPAAWGSFTRSSNPANGPVPHGHKDHAACDQNCP